MSSQFIGIAEQAARRTPHDIHVPTFARHLEHKNITTLEGALALLKADAPTGPRAWIATLLLAVLSVIPFGKR